MYKLEKISEYLIELQAEAYHILGTVTGSRTSSHIMHVYAEVQQGCVKDFRSPLHALHFLMRRQKPQTSQNHGNPPHLERRSGQEAQPKKQRAKSELLL